MPITAKKLPRPETSISQRVLAHTCPACEVQVARVDSGGLLLCHCMRCHHNWCSRLTSPPRACASCRSAYWTEPANPQHKKTKPAPERLPVTPKVEDLAVRYPPPPVHQTFLTKEQAESLLPPPPGMQPEVKVVKVEPPPLTVAEHVPESELEGEWAEEEEWESMDEVPDDLLLSTGERGTNEETANVEPEPAQSDEPKE